ncbi:PfkB family carbohydrate kinase [Pseudomonas sp. NPDC096917]|uniref:PfkB family carbohydrate kinase n=1 Tax=Pseudomonas sp. NPDC096917 TaxID=3364483 RepID=UPI00383A8EA5
MSRLLHTGQVIIDLVMALETLPRSGGDELAKSASFHAAGGFNTMAAAQRNGLNTLYLGRHGRGQFGDIARLALQAEGIKVIQPIDPDKDTGLCVALTEANAERTFISCIGAEGVLSNEDLATVHVEPDDYLYISGYSLLHPGKAKSLLSWLTGLARSVHVTFDPGPLLQDIDPALISTLLPRLHLWTSNRSEALGFTASTTIADALLTLKSRLPDNCLVVVRDGPQGCWINNAQGPQLIAGFNVDAIDSNGAGDAHTGVMIAALSTGHTAPDAAQRANAAAAIAVTRWGPATAPNASEIDCFIQSACSAAHKQD